MKRPYYPFNWLVGSILAGVLVVWIVSARAAGARPLPAIHTQAQPLALSPLWGPDIQQWSAHIIVLADVYGLDPDFIAAVINEESNGRADLVSEAGAVGLMGVMPTSPGLEWRPSTAELQNPAVNLRWGVGILAEVVQQAGGDLYAALAAYSGGWNQVNNRVPRAYAARVLDNYGRAIVARNGQPPDVASQWTIAVEINRGYVPNEPLLILGDQPEADLHLLGKHIVYNSVDAAGQAYYVVGYAVPVALLAPLNPNSDMTLVSEGSEMQLYQPPLSAQAAVKSADSNLHIMIACLPSLERLRGQNSTRWFAPSQCPSSHR
jgi:hypothetical protein